MEDIPPIFKGFLSKYFLNLFDRKPSIYQQVNDIM